MQIESGGQSLTVMWSGWPFGLFCARISEPGKFPAILPESWISLKGQEGRTAFPTV